MKKNIATLLLLLFTITYAYTQDKKEVYFEDYVVSLDPSIKTNRSHPYIDHISSQDELYIAWIYAINKKNMQNTPEYEDPAVIINDQDGNNSLIFTLEKKGVITYDTLRNSIHDLSKEKEGTWAKLKRIKDQFLKTIGSKCQDASSDFLRDQDLRGSLPKGSMMWHEDKRWGLAFGVKVPNQGAHVQILISDRNGNEVTTIIDKPLRKGWNNFKWKRGQNPRGTYNISITIDGQTMTQNFES